MKDEPVKDSIARIAGKLAGPGRHIVFTGAGISTESGISDYRSKGGIWDRFKPIYFDEFMHSKDARIEYWRRKIDLYRELLGARPNIAHRLLAVLHDSGYVDTVITQNIDGLHQEAGFPDEKVIELHGNTRRIRCMSCGMEYPLDETLKRIKDGEPAPECRCGGYLKPDTISFGQSLPPNLLEQAFELSRTSDVFIVIGSTLVVSPASRMPDEALKNGAFLAIINLSETPYDDRCHVLIRNKAGRVLQQITKSCE
ncbi:MAG: sigma factor regulator FecR [Deltaproteobacteria bacterium]|nr:sigma factor regulator FecR [Deltaproteobacteria bacterium]